MNINLHIERLVLDGVSLERGHEPQFRAAVEMELARLLSGAGLSTELMSGGAVESLQAGAIHLPAERSSSQQLGQQVARAVYGGIGR